MSQTTENRSKSNMGSIDYAGHPRVTCMVLMLGIVEVGGALLLLWGGFGPDWATRISGLLLTVVMIGAIVMAHAQYGWSSVNMGNSVVESATNAGYLSKIKCNTEISKGRGGDKLLMFFVFIMW